MPGTWTQKEWQVCVLTKWDKKRQLRTQVVTQEGVMQGFTQVSSIPSPKS